jgi:hypothetical protein
MPSEPAAERAAAASSAAAKARMNDAYRFALSSSRVLGERNSDRLGHAICLSILLAAMPVAAQDELLQALPEAAQRDSPAKPPTLVWRATQVNRCAKAKGALALQDRPCAPPPAETATATAGVADLSSITPRPPATVTRPTVPDTATPGFTKGLLNGAWKLALLVLACYFLWRALQAMRDSYRRLRHPSGGAQGAGRRRVR